MDMIATYVLFCVVPLLLGWLALTGALVLIAHLSDHRRRPPRRVPPTGGLEEVLRRWRTPPGAQQGQAT